MQKIKEKVLGFANRNSFSSWKKRLKDQQTEEKENGAGPGRSLGGGNSLGGHVHVGVGQQIDTNPSIWERRQHEDKVLCNAHKTAPSMAD